jgi:plasmid stability protein
MIQVRDVPDEVHRVLKSRAAREGMSLSDYIKRELAQSAQRPSMTEWLERVQSRRPIAMKHSAAEIVREMREPR